MVVFRKLDAFAKARPDLQQKSVVGGVITAIALTTALLLFIAQIAFYVMGSTQHSLHLAKSLSTPLALLKEHEGDAENLNAPGRIPLFVYVTFPHLPCQQLDVTLDGASLLTGELEKIHGKHSIKLRLPTSKDRSAAGNAFPAGRGCTLIGHLRPQIVAGVFAISISKNTWTEATRQLTIRAGADESSISDQLMHFNVSHFIHNIQFGESFPHAASKPLENRGHWITNSFGGIAVEHVQVKLIPTLYRKMFSEALTYQASVADHTIQPSTLVTKGVPYLPGLVISYDFTPLAVHHSGGRDNILVFLSSLMSIVGGVFVTVGLVTGCLVHSAQAVAKKID